jgi:hypothetical protein
MEESLGIYTLVFRTGEAIAVEMTESSLAQFKEQYAKALASKKPMLFDHPVSGIWDLSDVRALVPHMTSERIEAMTEPDFEEDDGFLLPTKEIARFGLMLASVATKAIQAQVENDLDVDPIPVAEALIKALQEDTDSEMDENPYEDGEDGDN